MKISPFVFVIFTSLFVAKALAFSSFHHGLIGSNDVQSGVSYQRRLSSFPRPSTFLLRMSALADPAADKMERGSRIRHIWPFSRIRRPADVMQENVAVNTSTSKNVKLSSVTKNRKSIYVVESLEEYKNVVAVEKDAIVVVRFFASWCKTCRATESLFYRLARTYPKVKFVEVPVTKDNKILHQGLGVKKVPFGHIYHPSAGLVEEMSITRGKKFKTFEETLRTYVHASCDVKLEDSE